MASQHRVSTTMSTRVRTGDMKWYCKGCFRKEIKGTYGRTLRLFPCSLCCGWRRGS